MSEQPCALAGPAGPVGCIHFVESACDKGAIHATTLSDALEHNCRECNVAFGTARALASHNRTKHGVRAEQRFYCFSNGVCQQCGTNFNTRLRLMAHLCDSRRAKCWDAISSQPDKFHRLSDGACEKLDLKDRSECTKAYGEGKSHPTVIGSARTKAGKQVGFAKT